MRIIAVLFLQIHYRKVFQDGIKLEAQFKILLTFCEILLVVSEIAQLHSEPCKLDQFIPILEKNPRIKKYDSVKMFQPPFSQFLISVLLYVFLPLM